MSTDPDDRRSRRTPGLLATPRFDPLFIAALGGIIVVGIVVVVDLFVDGSLDPAVLALLVSVVGPLTPALLMRSRKRDDD